MWGFTQNWVSFPAYKYVSRCWRKQWRTEGLFFNHTTLLAVLQKISSGSKSVRVSLPPEPELQRTTRAPLCCLCCHWLEQKERACEHTWSTNTNSAPSLYELTCSVYPLPNLHVLLLMLYGRHGNSQFIDHLLQFVLVSWKKVTQQKTWLSNQSTTCIFFFFFASPWSKRACTRYAVHALWVCDACQRWCISSPKTSADIRCSRCANNQSTWGGGGMGTKM